MRLFYLFCCCFLLTSLRGQDRTADRVASELAETRIAFAKAEVDSARLAHIDKLSELFYFSQQYDSSFYYAHQEIELAKSLQQDRFIAKGYRALAIIETRVGKLEVALNYGDSAIYYFQEAKDTAGVLIGLTNQAFTASEIGECNKAIDCCKRADSLQQDYTIPIAMTVSFRNTISAVYQNCEMYELAINTAKEYVPYCIAQQDFTRLSSLYNRLVINYRRMGELDSSLVYVQKTQDILSEMSRSQISAYYTNASLLYMDMEEYDRAHEILILGLSLAEENNDPRSIAHKRMSLGKVQYLRKEYAESVAYFELGRTFFEEAGQSDEVIEYYGLMAEAYTHLQEYEKALGFWRIQAQYQDSLKKLEQEDLMEELMVRFETERVQRQLAERNLELNEVKLDKQYQQERYASQRRWAILGLSLLALFVGAIVYLRQLRDRRKKLEYEKRQAELRYSLLRAQMNPHFIFNSLNSIQNFFSNQSFKKGNEFLGSFSQLIRRVLDQTGQKVIPLSEELETLELYLSLENLRLNQELSYDIYLSPNVESEIMRVPPLIFQPFVENAIWHGIAPKPGPGRIEISVDYNEKLDALSCVIEDDGVGMQQERERNLNHRSQGVAISRERLGATGHIEILDLGAAGSGRTGVRTDLIIPLWD